MGEELTSQRTLGIYSPFFNTYSSFAQALMGFKGFVFQKG